MTCPPLLLLTTLDSALASRSGYQVLADYLPGEVIAARRADPSGGFALLRARVMRRMAFSRWYLAGCEEMELRARARLQAGFDGIVHFLWCDRDLGFLDRSLNPKRHRLVGTFHNSADDLPRVIRSPKRLRDFAAVILMSATQRQYFAANGVEPSRLHVIPHGVDTEHFRPLEERARGEFVVLAVGGYRRDFAMLRRVCDAFAGVRDVRFEITGPRAIAERFAGCANVQFHHGISDAELLAKYQGASCLIHLAEQATANNVVLEALACGLPVVTQRLGGIPEYVTPECGILCEPESEKNVVDAVRALADSPSRAAELRAGARVRARALDWKNIAAQTVELYRTLA